MPENASTLLTVHNLTKSFGGIVAVNQLSLEVRENAIQGLIGPNGSGKTVTFDCITGFTKPDSGRVKLRDEDVTGLRPFEIARRGLARSFQLTSLFPRLTVYQNLAFSSQGKILRENLWSLWRPGSSEKAHNSRSRIPHILELTGLAAYSSELARNLPHGLQKVLELATLLVMEPEPEFLLLDEPTAGLSPQETSRVVELIEKLRNAGKTFLIVEHDMRLIMNVCDLVTVLNYGVKIVEGKPEEIQRDERVIEAYLGKRK